jgi:hypothetical protein
MGVPNPILIFALPSAELSIHCFNRKQHFHACKLQQCLKDSSKIVQASNLVWNFGRRKMVMLL